jgi:hypothetical protein
VTEVTCLWNKVPLSGGFAVNNADRSKGIGTNVGKLVADMRRLCQEVDNLLSEADEVLGEDWVSLCGSSTIRGPTYKKSEYWFPWFFCRFYTHTERKGLLLYVAVVLDDPFGHGFNVPGNQPLFTAGFYCGKEGTGRSVRPKGVGESLDRWICLYHLWRPDCRLDGRLQGPAVPKDQRKDLSSRGLRNELWSLACPLVSITGTAKLEAAMKPLLEKCKKT